jgi:CRISPR-associated Csx2 family protein
MSILLTTLGRAYKSGGDAYRKTRYRFPDGREIESVFFGYALYQWLRNSGNSIQKVVILGTEGSSWDILVDGGDEELYYRFVDRTRMEDEDLLRDVERYLSENWGNTVSCRIIPDGFHSEEQYRILSIINQEIPEDTGLWMDITHGFRSLPVLELFSSMNLEETKNVHLKGIYYGMFDKNENNMIVKYFNEIRKYGCGLWLGGQSITHFDDDIVSNAGTKLILGVDRKDATSFANKLKIDVDLINSIAPQKTFIAEIKESGKSSSFINIEI